MGRSGVGWGWISKTAPKLKGFPVAGGSGGNAHKADINHDMEDFKAPLQNFQLNAVKSCQAT